MTNDEVDHLVQVQSIEQVTNPSGLSVVDNDPSERRDAQITRENSSACNTRQGTRRICANPDGIDEPVEAGKISIEIRIADEVIRGIIDSGSE